MNNRIALLALAFFISVAATIPANADYVRTHVTTRYSVTKQVVTYGNTADCAPPHYTMDDLANSMGDL